MFISRVVVENVSFSKCLPNIIAMLLYKVGLKIFFPFRVIGDLFQSGCWYMCIGMSRVRSRTTSLLYETGKVKIIVITLPQKQRLQGLAKYWYVISIFSHIEVLLLFV